MMAVVYAFMAFCFIALAIAAVGRPGPVWFGVFCLTVGLTWCGGPGVDARAASMSTMSTAPVSVGLAILDAAAREYQSRAKAPNTLRAYRTD